MINSTFEFEEKLFSEGYEIVIGIDEAGRGPLAGPVVACAVAYKCHPELVSGSMNKDEILKQVQDDKNKIQNDKKWDLIKDSKMLSEKQRENLFDFIQDNFYVGVGICNHKTIDRINILEATFLAMKEAIVSLSRNIKHEEWNKNKIILLDGNKNISNLSIEQKCIIGGDKLVKSISAASIIAKVTRDRIMKEMHEKYPQYNFLQHKGYGTKLHMDALKKFGPCEIHRKSFAPVKKCII